MDLVILYHNFARDAKNIDVTELMIDKSENIEKKFRDSIPIKSPKKILAFLFLFITNSIKISKDAWATIKIVRKSKMERIFCSKISIFK